MNDYDHHDYRREIERMEAQRREDSAAYRAAINPDPPDPDAARTDGPWQLRFILRFTLQMAFWSWIVWWLLGSPKIPIKWLQ